MLLLLVQDEPLLFFGEIAPELSEPLRMKMPTAEGLFVDIIPFQGSSTTNGGDNSSD